MKKGYLEGFKAPETGTESDKSEKSCFTDNNDKK